MKYGDSDWSELLSQMILGSASVYHPVAEEEEETPAWVPTDIDGCTLWLKADQITGLDDGDSVGTWKDQSGEGNDVSQGTANKKPTYKVDILNGKPVVRFDGTDDRLGLATMSISVPYTTIWVVRCTDDDADSIVADMGTEYIRVFNDRFSVNGTNYCNVYDSRIDYDMASFASFVFVHNSQDSVAKINGDDADGSFSIRPDYASKDITSFDIGELAHSAYPLSIDIAEIIVYNSAVSGTNLDNVHTYANNEYSLW